MAGALPPIPASSRAIPRRSAQTAFSSPRCGDTRCPIDSGKATSPMATPTYPTTPGRVATEADALDLGRTALIGTFGAPEARAGLVRMASGRIRRVEAGDRLLGGRILRVEPDGLLIDRDGTVGRLPLAGQG